MNLAELHLLAQDLDVLTDLALSDFYLNSDYRYHNTFTAQTIFPIFIMQNRPLAITPHLNKVGRWGRHLLLSFTSCTVVFKMSYRTNVYVSRGKYPTGVAQQDVTCVLSFFDCVACERLYFIYTDPAKCGHVSIYPASETPTEFSYLGLDVFDHSFCGSYLISEALKLRATGKKRNIKSFIMDNHIIAHVDNEVASDALFFAQLNPTLDVTTELHSSQAAYLAKSIVSTYSALYAHLKNDSAITEKIPLSYLYCIFGHKDCVVCDTSTQKCVIDGKPTYFCPKCQNVKNGVLK